MPNPPFLSLLYITHLGGQKYQLIFHTFDKFCQTLQFKQCSLKHYLAILVISFDAAENNGSNSMKNLWTQKRPQ